MWYFYTDQMRLTKSELSHPALGFCPGPLAVRADRGLDGGKSWGNGTTGKPWHCKKGSPVPKKGREAREYLQSGLSGAVKVQSPVKGCDLYEISTSFQLFQQELDILHFFLHWFYWLPWIALGSFKSAACPLCCCFFWPVTRCRNDYPWIWLAYGISPWDRSSPLC